MRFHLDEHVADAIADELRKAGIDVTTTVDAGLNRAADERHVEFAAREGRVTFTFDYDFLAVAERGDEHAGIVYCRQRTRTIGQIVTYLKLLHDYVDPADMRNVVERVPR